jgi:cholesterol transport system auxiliary component
MNDQHSTFRPSLRPGRRIGAAFLLTMAAALGACSSSAVPGFDLSAPRDIRGNARVPGQVVVVEPTALQPFDTQNIIVRDASGSVSLLGSGQWTDRLPRLIQTRLIQTFENASARAVSRPGDGITPDYQLNTEVRAFQLDAARGEAFVELSEKLVATGTGRILRARIFAARVPVGSSNAGEVAQALDRAMSTVFVGIVRWVGSGR